MASFFTSDTHFFHRNSIKYCAARSHFQDELEMNEALVKAWNDKVSPDDLVYHLGDFAFASTSKTLEIMSRLNFKNLVLISGNHDHKLLKNSEFRDRFYNIENSYYETKIDNIHVTMCHYPLVSWNGMHYGSYHLHGHTHGNYHHPGRGLDVGVDNREDLAPWTWEEICEYMETRPPETKINY